ncbi:MAG: hypothetical protein ABIJ27_07155, partial [Candidatus Omnitrophota bacterium]
PISLLSGSQYSNRFSAHFDFYALLLLCASFGLFFAAPFSAANKGIVLLTVVYYMMLHGVLFLSQGPRYKSPMDPFLAIIVAYALIRAVQLLSRRADGKGSAL